MLSDKNHMAKRDFCEVVLTCANRKEAEKIADTLLQKRLIACAKFVPIESKYHWKGKIEFNPEIMLMMESKLDLFDKIEAEVAKLHSYDTFVLRAVPMAKLSKKAQAWLERETKALPRSR